MSNYADDFNGHTQDHRDSLPEDILPADAERVYQGQACYRAIMRVAVHCMKASELVLADKKTIESFGWAVEDLLTPQVNVSLKNLEGEGFDLDLRNDGHDAFLDEIYAVLKGKPRLVGDQMRPVSTNPSTHAARGEPL